ncbi:beta-1,6-N-acetylglucosaminyltransferase [Novosphingobium sp. ZN18A2]|uniref:beta-1,6-N-acetylglucosaminyltransferase n=1 Tax=Novosphingobium sp. ZN18A2 TaxID=3079861 RepID=UPI0030CED43A
MRMAYLVLAHEKPAQLRLLIDRLLAGDHGDIVVLHVDRSSALWRSGECADLAIRPRVHLVADPVSVRWAHWSQVAAIHRICTRALEVGFDHAHLISGVDWPVAARDEIARRIAADGNRTCYLEAKPGVMAERMQTRRLDSRWLRVDPERDRLAYAACWELRRVSRWIDAVLPARTQPFGQWHKGSSWWSMPADAMRAIMADVSRVLASGRLTGTQCADEHLIQTIAARKFGDRLAPTMRFIDMPSGQSSPRTLLRADAPAIAASGAWFARKVDAGADDFFLRGFAQG